MAEAIWMTILHFILPLVVVAGIFTALMMYVAPREVRTIFKREIRSFFTSPIAYVCVVIFLLISNGISFWFGGVLERGEADLMLSYFQYLPWYFIILAPIVGMRLWSEEQRLGTMELILTMPIAPWQAILGKYLAASVVLFTMLALSFPIVLTMNYLGDPDNGVILSGFVASYLVSLTFLAITSVFSAITRSQIVSVLISVVLCLFFWLIGLEPVISTAVNLGGSIIGELTESISMLSHFNELAKGILGTRDLIYFFTFIAFCLFSTSVVLKLKRS